MSEAKHSEGPWAFEEGDREKRDMARIFKAKDREFLIGYTLCDFRNELQRAEDVANARLMAAAPDLLAACEWLVKASESNGYFGSNDKPTKMLVDARAAIEKAKGGAA